MATDAEVKAAGYTLPGGSDQIRLGDDAIRANAHAAYTGAKAAASAADAAAGNLSALEQRVVPLENLPTEVSDLEGRVTPLEALPDRLTTVEQLSASIIPIRTVANGEDADQWRTTATLRIGSDIIAASIVNRPPDGRMATVLVNSVAGIVSHLWIENYRSAAAGAPRIFYRATEALGPVRFSAWVPLTGEDLRTALTALEQRVSALEAGSGTATTDYGLRHQMMQDVHRRRRGGTIGTSGRAPVAIRLDHGFAKFQPILDLLNAYSLPATLACFAHQFDAEGAQHTLNNGWTWAMIQDAALDHGLEVANHSSTHYDATTLADLHDEIVQGRDDLRAHLPRLAVDGWITPGVGGTGYMDGWNTTPDLEKWATTPAGRMVLAHHAWAEGYTPGELHVLDGTIRAGRHSWTIDAATRAAQVESLIARAVATQTGINFMIHPANVGNLDMLDLTRLEEIFAHLAAERDAGRIEILTLGGWMMADTRSAYRLNIAHDLTEWNLGTATVNAEGIATITGAQISDSISLTNAEQYKGGVFEAVVEIRSSGTSTPTLTVTDSSGAVSATCTGTLPVNEWQTIRRPFTIPRSGSTGITLSVSRSGAALQVRNPVVRPI